MNIDQETLSSLLSRVSLSLPRLITAVVIFAIMLFLAGLVAKLIQRACNKRKLDREATLLLSRLGRYGTITLGISGSASGPWRDPVCGPAPHQADCPTGHWWLAMPVRPAPNPGSV